MNVEKNQLDMNAHIENHVRDNLPAAIKPNEYHRVVTVALLLPADEECRNAIITRLSPPDSIGGMQILEARQGFAGIELDAARQLIEDPEGFAEHCGKLAARHNLTLAMALGREEEGQGKQLSHTVPMLHPWKDLMLSLRDHILGIAAALAVVVVFNNLIG